MGLLDDAIREHLDLKRRRGADPMEIEQAEREALGPVGRVPTADDAEMNDEPASQPDAEYGHEEDGWDEPFAESVGEQGLAGEEHEYDEAEEDQPHGSAGEEWDIRSDRGSTAEDADTRPGRETQAPPTRPAEASGQETEEYNVEDEHRREAGGHGDDGDMLEETPEFLQDTPDHDRLWFEQKPPRDFDFDG
jgi:hypothetical protein